MGESSRFSSRYGFQPLEAEITIRYEATHELRGVVRDIAYESGLRPGSLRGIVCKALRKREDPNNWSEFPNIHDEVGYLLDDCEWYEVYDVIEEIWQYLFAHSPNHGGHTPYCLRQDDSPGFDYFASEINKYFRKAGIGWHLLDGKLQIRGTESFEGVVRGAIEALHGADRITAEREIKLALQDLSRRPEPDITGALQHSIAALECTARDICGDQRLTLGKILERYPTLLPSPLNQCVEKAWGYASEHGRHLREGRNPRFEEAELIVGIVSAVTMYLIKKAS